MAVKKVAPKAAPTLNKQGESPGEASSSGEEESSDSEEEENKVHDMTMESKKSKRENQVDFSTTLTGKEQ